MKPTQPTESQFRRYYRAFADVAEQPKTRAYSGAIFSFLAISLFGLYAILPTIQTILFLQREIADKTNINKQMEEKISALIEGQAAYEAAGDNISLVAAAIPSTAKSVELALTLRNLSRATDASISALQVASVPLVVAEATMSAQSRASTLSSFSITVITRGGFPNLKSFLDGLLSIQRIVTIDSFRFSPAPDTTGIPGGVPLQLVLQLKAYYQSP